MLDGWEAIQQGWNAIFPAAPKPIFQETPVPSAKAETEERLAALGMLERGHFAIAQRLLAHSHNPASEPH